MTEAQAPAPAMALVDSVLVRPPGTIDEEEPFPALPPASPAAQAADADDQPKHKGRPRLMRGISRMSSFPNLKGRARASSTPYDRSGAAMSCSNLAPSSSASSSFAPLTSPASRSGEPSSSSLSMLAPLSSPCTRLATDVQGSNSDAAVVQKAAAWTRPRRTFNAMWAALPYEVKIHVLNQLTLRELVSISRINREFYRLCFDGQLWTSFDASDFYTAIPAAELVGIMNTAGPFVKNLNLRGCMQMGSLLYTRKMAYACRNLVNVCLEGVQIEDTSLHILLSRNANLVSLNLSGLSAVSKTVCNAISEYCPYLEVLNLSWCRNVLAKELAPLIHNCTKLRDLRLSELRGADTDMTFANALFQTNRLERLILCGSPMVSNRFVMTLMRGSATDNGHPASRPNVPPRRLRHLDLSNCRKLTAAGILPLAHCVPELEGLVLSGCTALNDASLIPVLATCAKLTHVELDDLEELTNALLTDHLLKSPSVATLKHLSLSNCDKIGDAGVLPLLRECKALRSLVVDNTLVSNLMLAEAISVIAARGHRTRNIGALPRSGLSLTVYDCPHITWTGIREVLSRNTEVVEGPPRKMGLDGPQAPDLWYPTQIITLKCFYGWQMTVDEHTKRVLRGDFAAAARLEHKWGHYMQASEEAGMGGRRRRRRAREAEQVHNIEAGPEALGPVGARRRARTASCAVM